MKGKRHSGRIIACKTLFRLCNFYKSLSLFRLMGFFSIMRPMKTQASLNRRLSIAPMMEWTTRDYRYFMRLLTRHTLLYTEMVTAAAVVHGDRERLLGFDSVEGPIAVQLGGSDAALLAQAARHCEDFGYDEINLNVGCPSVRVQSGSFGACLMAEPRLVADCVAAMQAEVDIPVTVKTRIGIDDQDSYEFLYEFIETVATTGCEHFIIHARKAFLKGLSPRENRDVPPLIYDRAYHIKRDFPQLEISINGGIQTLNQAQEHLEQVDGVMIGRAAYHHPWRFNEADEVIFGEPKPSTAHSAHQVVEAFLPYVEARFAEGTHPKHVLRHIFNIFQGVPGARAFRRHLSTHAHLHDATPQVLLDALALVPR